MHILIGLGLAVALLYFWLIGHWFARILTFIILASGLGFAGASWVAANAGQDAVTGAVIGAAGGMALAWYISSIPLWVQRAKEKRHRWARQAMLQARQASAPIGMPPAPALALPAPHRTTTD